MFTAAGKDYTDIRQLENSSLGEIDGIKYQGYKISVYQDVYGRRVLYFRERFPCFDSYDFMYENRYYHWHIVEGEKGLTVVYTQDEKPGVQVCENDAPGNKMPFYFPTWIAEELKALQKAAPSE